MRRRRTEASLMTLALLVGACVSPSASSTTPPSSSATTAPSPSPVASPIAWTRVFSGDLIVLNDIVAAPPGLIAVGYTTNTAGSPESALMLTSPDGVAWTQVGLAGAANANLGSISVAGNRLSALGIRTYAQASNTAGVWSSLDGQSWKLIDAASFKGRSVDEVIASPAGVLAVGMHLPSQGTTNWGEMVVWDVATDGSFGQPRDVRPAGWPGNPLGVIWTGERYLTWAWEVPASGDENQLTVLMTSVTGKTWTVVPRVRAFVGALVSQIAVADGRFVAVGYTGEAYRFPHAWVSTDGVSWQAAQIPLSQGGELDTVRLEGTRFVARGQGTVGNDARPLAWTSSDGMSWTAVSLGSDAPDVAGFVPGKWATLGERVCVAGAEVAVPRAEIYCR